MADVRIVSKTPCTCCGGGGGCVFQCRTKGGAVNYCGSPDFSEEENQSFYKKASVSGSLTLCLFDTPDCSDPQAGGRLFVWSGACEFDAVSYSECENVGVGSMISYNPIVGCSMFGPANPDVPGCGIGQAGGFVSILASTCDQEVTDTSITFTGNGSCYNFGGGRWRTSGTMTLELSEEDTYGDAVARLMAVVDWSEWGSGCVAASAFYSSNFQGEWRIQGTSLEPGAAYEIDVTLWRSTSPDGPFALFATQTYGGIAGPDGTLNFSAGIFNTFGYYTEARCDCVFRKIS